MKSTRHSKPPANTLDSGQKKKSGKSRRSTMSAVPPLPQTIFQKYESGVSDSWSWEADLSVHPDGGYSLHLQLIFWDSCDDSDPSSYTLERFHSGKELFDFLQDAWVCEHEESISKNEWREIVMAVRPYDDQLAAQILERLNEK